MKNKKLILILLGFISFIWGLFNCIYVDMLSRLIDTVVSNKNLVTTTIFFISYLFLWMLEEVVLDFITELFACKNEENIAISYFDRAYKIKPSVLKSNNTGYITGLLNGLIDRKLTLDITLISEVPITCIYIIYFIVKLCSYHFLFGTSFLLLISLGIIVRICGTKIEKKYLDNVSEIGATNNRLLIDSMTNINTIQKMQAHKFIKEKMLFERKRYSDSCVRWSVINSVFANLYKTIMYMHIPLSMFLYYSLQDGAIANKTSLFSLLSIVSIQVIHIARNITRAISSYNRYKTNKTKIDKIICDKNNRINISSNEFKSVSLKNIDYSYTLENVELPKKIHVKIPDFTLNKGDFVCVSGESGQGKTTLLNILSGEIETSGVFINGDSTDTNRLNCVFVSQDTEILDMSVRDNLTLGNKDITDEDILDCINRVGLSDWLSRQEKGLDTCLGERGIFVSTGQRQRLNLVRGLLIIDKEIYLLDEPTSNVDEKTEVLMVNLIKEKLKGKTVVIITHRPKIKEICNKHYLFKDNVLQKA